MVYCKTILSILSFIYIHVEAQNKFRVDLIAGTLKEYPNRNIVISTLSIEVFLCKLASVADIETKTEIMTVLGFSEDMLSKYYKYAHDIIQSLKQTDMYLFNKIYVNYTDDVDAKLFKNSDTEFGVQFEKVGFNTPVAASIFINNAISKDTLKRITRVVDDSDMTMETKMLLLTAAYYKPSWDLNFDIRNTELKNFYHQNGGVQKIPMMTKIIPSLIYDGNYFKFLIMPLKPEGLIISFILPSPLKGIPGLLEAMQQYPDILNSARGSNNYADVKVVLPRFRIRRYLDMTNVIRFAGVNRLLNDTLPGLNTILKENNSISGNFYVNKIKQNIFFDVNEFGVIREIKQQEQMPSDLPLLFSFVADRPFFYAVSFEMPKVKGNSSVNHELFCGIYFGPE